jgi:hypothetical protein
LLRELRGGVVGLRRIGLGHRSISTADA